MSFRNIKGTKDILPPDSAVWQRIEAAVRAVMADYRYAELRTPVFEQTQLFSRSIGELTDIVSKEMYTFQDRGGESVTLRPEGTAAVIRAYLQHNLGSLSPLTKLYYAGPMFRQERPQAGRLRQFHQFGAEAIGSSSPYLDVEMMVIPIRIYESLGLSSFELVINSVGCERCRPAYKEKLISALRKVETLLSDDSRARIDKNPLRVLDSKDTRDREATQDVPVITDNLCAECSEHFGRVRTTLDSLSLAFSVNPRLVRGLDYYTKTAFEVTSSELGSQDALAGGGRYDLLTQELGGQATPGVGFAAGIERLIMVLDKAGASQAASEPPQLYIVTADEGSRAWAFETAVGLRNSGVSVEIDYTDRSVKAQMREANRSNATYVVVVGEKERTSGTLRLKHMGTGTETETTVTSLGKAVTDGRA